MSRICLIPLEFLRHLSSTDFFSSVWVHLYQAGQLRLGHLTKDTTNNWVYKTANLCIGHANWTYSFIKFSIHLMIRDRKNYRCKIFLSMIHTPENTLCFKTIACKNEVGNNYSALLFDWERVNWKYFYGEWTHPRFGA
jgi:hypothetical protein